MRHSAGMLRLVSSAGLLKDGGNMKSSEVMAGDELFTTDNES